MHESLDISNTNNISSTDKKYKKEEKYLQWHSGWEFDSVSCSSEKVIMQVWLGKICKQN